MTFRPDGNPEKNIGKYASLRSLRRIFKACLKIGPVISVFKKNFVRLDKLIVTIPTKYGM